MKRSLKRGGWPNWGSKSPEPAVEPLAISDTTNFKQESYGTLVAKVATKLRGDPEAMEILTSALSQTSNESDKITLLKQLDNLEPEELKQHLIANKRVYGFVAGGRKSRRRRNKSRKQRKTRR
jgi:hypothetical protein